MDLAKILPWPNAGERHWQRCRRIIAGEAAAKLGHTPAQIEYVLARLEAIEAPARLLGERGPDGFLSNEAVWLLVAAYGEIWRLRVFGLDTDAEA